VLLVVQEAGEQRIVEIVLNDPTASFANLADVIGLDSGIDWFVDSQPVASADLIGGVVFYGSVLSDTPADADALTGPGLRLDQIAGSNVGWTRHLRRGPNVLGRSEDVELQIDDPSTSGRHCRLDRGEYDAIEVTDLGSRNGTRVGGRRITNASLAHGDVMWAGSCVYRLASRVQSRPFLEATGVGVESGRLSFNRPPRDAVADPTSLLAVPDPAKAPAGVPFAFSIAAVVAPLIMAAAMVMVLGSARYALFALLSPVVAVLSWVESRSRVRREARRYVDDRQVRVSEFDATLLRLEETERSARWQRQPDLCELLSWMHRPGTRLWERRSFHSDILTIGIGVADEAWRPSLGPGVIDADLEPVIDRRLVDVPVEVSLVSGEVVGVVGALHEVRAVARAMVLSLGATVGPSDLRLVIAAERSHIRHWGWAAWLPHTASDPDDPIELGRPWVIDETDAPNALGSFVTFGDQSGALPQPAAARRGVLVVDGVSITAGRASHARRMWSDGELGWGGLVLAEREDQLPSECTVVVDVGADDGLSKVRWLREGRSADSVSLTRVGHATAVTAARAIARLDDPDLRAFGSALPGSVALADIDGFDLNKGSLSSAWRSESIGPNNSLCAPIGEGADGAFDLDLVFDGPHALVAGTTGSGKSELLRTWIVSLATRYPPQRLNFVLIDYKGGSAFDGVSGLPHVVGLVTDLDEHLGQRALVCLRAELTWREQQLRDREVADIADLTDGSLPRLVVVIDEFASLASELPRFLDSLVGIAQRGRSLGVHLILATQRPAGAVNDNIRTNTNLRIALRVQDVADSVDVIGDGSAATLPRVLPGRACVRLGPGEVITIQTAHVTGPRSELLRPKVELVTDSPGTPTPTTLEELLVLGAAEFLATGSPSQRRPWPEPLPDVVDATLLGLADADRADVTKLVVGVADEPEFQRRSLHGWSLADGNLMIAGVQGSGVESAMLAIALAAVKESSPEHLHLHAIEVLGSALRGIESWPHVGGVVGVNEPEKLVQLVHRHRSELERRVGVGGGEWARMILLIDHIGGLLGDNQSAEGLELVEDLRRVWTDGPAVGIHCVVGANRIGAVPSAWQSAAGQIWLFALADPSEYSQVGLVASQLPTFVPGRAITSDGLVFQLAEVDVEVDVAAGSEGAASAAVLSHDPVARVGPTPLMDMSVGVDVADLGGVELSGESWFIPIGRNVATAAIAGLRLYKGDHVLVAGAARSGVTNALGVIAGQLRGHVDLFIMARMNSPLRSAVPADRCSNSASDLLDAVTGSTAEVVVVIVDDAHLLDDPELLDVVSNGGCRMVAGGRADQLRRNFGHWTNSVGSTRTGILLRPDVDLDGDLLGVRLPRYRRDRAPAGRGALICDGDIQEVQLAVCK